MKIVSAVVRFVLCLFMSLLCSCSLNNGGSPLDSNNDFSRNDFAFEIVKEYYIQSFSLHSETGDLPLIEGISTKAISSSEVLELSNNSDTLFTSTEIPFSAQIKERTVIDFDGRTEFIQEIELDTTVCPLLSFYEAPLALDDYVAKVEIKDGKFRSYNRQGHIISECESDVPNMDDYVNEIQQLIDLAESENAAITKGETTRDINWLRSIMAKECQTKGSLSAGPYRIIEQNDGNVLLEQVYGGTKASPSFTTRVVFSPDILRTYSYEKIENNRIVEESLMYYSGQDAYNIIHINETTNVKFDAPNRIVTMKLSDASPNTITVTNQVFQTNNTHVYVNGRK